MNYNGSNVPSETPLFDWIDATCHTDEDITNFVRNMTEDDQWRLIREVNIDIERSRREREERRRRFDAYMDSITQFINEYRNQHQ